MVCGRGWLSDGDLNTTTHRYGKSLFMPGIQDCPSFLRMIQADNGLTLDNYLQGTMIPFVVYRLNHARKFLCLSGAGDLSGSRFSVERGIVYQGNAPC